MYKLDIGGRQFQGKPLQVIEQLQATVFGADTDTPREFIQGRAEAYGLKVDTDLNPASMAEQLIDKMIAAGHAVVQA